MGKTVITELEALFTANTDQVDAAFRRVKDGAEKVEKKPVKTKVDADVKGALAGMGRVEAEAKKVVSAKTVATVDANIERAEKNLERTKERLDYLRSVETDLEVTADIKRAETALSRAERQRDALVNARASMEVDADAAQALAALAQVEDAGRRIVSADVVARVDADISAAEKNVTRVQAQLEVLRSTDASPQVLVDISRAEDRLGTAEKRLADLRGARATMEVDADTSPAESALDEVADVAGQAGGDAGAEFGDSIIAALGTIPIAGAVVGIGAAAAKALVGAFQDGLAQEQGRDRLQALTGFDEIQARNLAAAAGEAYASGFGASVESNMDAVRLAAQFDLIDADASTRDAQKVVEGLGGIADVLGEDVQPVARATTQMLRTGLVNSAEEAFDVLATGAREGVNISEDLLDTFTEYPTHFRDLGLSAEEALGLLNQGMEGGARDSDKVADSLKELTLRVKDVGDEAAQGALKDLGLDGEEMARSFAEGGPAARDGLEQILTGLQSVEDPAERTRLALALFGTQSEDMAQALGALDLTTAVDQLNGVEGAAKRMFDTMADNDASKVDQAFRNIEVAADGVKGALATAFAEPLGDFADWVSSNRGPLLQFFADLINGAIDFAQTANSAIGDFVSGPMAEMVTGLVAVVDIFNGPFVGAPEHLSNLADSMRGFDETTDGANERLEQMRDEFNTFADHQVALGYVHDAAMRTAEAVGEVGVSADGTKLSLDDLDGANLSASDSGRKLEEQVRDAIAALDDEIATADAAGESQSDLTGRYESTTGALSDQLQEMGLTEEQAQDLIGTYAKMPEKKSTDISAPGAESARASVGDFRTAVDRLPSTKTVNIKVTGTADGFRLLRGAAIGGYGADIAERFATGGRPAPRRYTGELVHGPGTPTSDDIPAWISRREFVQQAAAVDYYGPGLMYALNARAIPKQLFSALGFAGGGSIIGGGGAFSPQTFQMTLALPQLAGLATGLSAATTQLLGMTEAVQLGTQVLPLKEIRSLGKQLDKASVKVADLSAKTQARTAAEELAARHLDDVKADLKEARADKAKTKSEKAAREKLVASLEKQVAKAETAKAAASEKAKASTDKLSEAQRAQTDIANDLARAHQQLADDARRAGEALSDAFLRDVEDAESLIAELAFGTSSMRDFTGDIEKLRKAGLSEDIIQILVGKGVEVGNTIADGILAGGDAMVKQLNDLAKKFAKQADLLGLAAVIGVKKNADGGILEFMASGACGLCRRSRRWCHRTLGASSATARMSMNSTPRSMGRPGPGG